MNSRLILSLIPALTIVFLMMGIYKMLLEKKVRSKERVAALFSHRSNSMHFTADQASAGKNSDKMLKWRRKSRGDKTLSSLEKLEVELEIKLERANWLISLKQFWILSLASGCLGAFMLGLALCKSIPLAILLGLACLFLPYVGLVIKGILRTKKAAAQFADVLDNMVNAFKTGYGFSRAVQLVADNYTDPWGTEFGKLATEINLGASMEEGLFDMARRMPSPDMDLFITALLIQKETGGSLAELLGTLSQTIRNRYKLFQRIGAISAQGKLSAGVICCVPFLLCGIMFLFLPVGMVQFFTNPIGIVLAILAGLWMLFGMGVLYRIVQVEV